MAEQGAAPRSEGEASRERVLEAAERVRPRLHGYCSRLLGSSLDGEDVVQDALARALISRPPVASSEELEHWLFRVAHNRCTDLLRRRSVRSRADWHWVDPNHDRPVEPIDRAQLNEIVDGAFGRVVRLLPPKERAAVLLKDVLDFSLEETAEIIDSTVGGVKAALHRGRTKLATLPRAGEEEFDGASGATEPIGDDPPDRIRPNDPVLVRLLEEYVERFQRRDWDGLISLVRSDARLEVVGVFEGEGLEHFQRLYFTNYSRLEPEWSACVQELDDEMVMRVERPLEAACPDVHGPPAPRGLYSLVRVGFDAEGRISSVRDYLHAPPYLILAAARDLDLEAAPFHWSHIPNPAQPD